MDAMNVTGVDGALIVHSSKHGFDHSYVTSVLQAYPTKFAGCLLANPDEVGRRATNAEHKFVL